MNQYQPIRHRASVPTDARRTTGDYPPLRQTMQRRWSEPSPADDEEPETFPGRLPSSTRRYTTRDGRALVPLTPQPHPRPEWRHPLMYVGVGVLSASILVAVTLGPVVQLLTNWQDNITYGNPRTFQTDAVVAHHDTPSQQSHFVALNLKGQILVIEFPGDDPRKARDFLITTLSGPDADQIPVTLSFKDVNGDGKPDMLITWGNQQIVYINDQGTFRPVKAGDDLYLNS